MADASVDGAQSRFFARVNAARNDPVGQAKAFGVDTKALFKERPWLFDIFSKGLSPLSPDVRVNAAAAGHTADMFDRDYYAEISPDGRTPLNRIRHMGYPAESAGEALGMITFFNFLPIDMAADHLFRNMFLRELRSAPRDALRLLSPAFVHAGVSIRGGAITEKGIKKNAYVVCLDAATPLKNDWEPELIEMINEFRRSPFETARMLGITDELPLTEKETMPPLAVNDTLARVAGDQGVYILSSGNLSGEAADRAPAIERMRAMGYAPAIAAEAARVISSVIPLEPQGAARELLARLIRRELADSAEDRVLLNSHARDIGIYCQYDTPEDAFKSAAYLSGFYNAVLVIEAASALPTAHERPYLIGTVFKDLNDDGRYGYGEGAAGMAVMVSDLETAGNGTLLLTNPAGGFMLRVTAGHRYAVTLENESPLFIKAVDSTNLSVIFQLPTLAP